MKKYKIEHGTPQERTWHHRSGSKYDELFGLLAPGVCVPFDTEREMWVVYASLHRMIRRHGKPWKLVMRGNCPDGKSRLFVVAEGDKAPARRTH